MVVLFTGFHRMNIYIYIYICPSKQKKKRKKEKESASKVLPFSHLTEMMLFTWRSIKNIILLDRRLVAFPFFLSFFFFFFSFSFNL